MQYEVLTDIGRKRTVNEDSAAVYVHSDGTLLAVIADGMGGHQGGDHASSTAVRLIGEQFLQLDSATISTELQCQEWLMEIVLQVNRLLFNQSIEDKELKGMGTTLEVAIIQGDSCLLSHTGDSRVYSISCDGVRQITRDHSYVNVLLDSGEISEEEAAVHPKRNWIIKAIGSERSIEPDFYSINLHANTYLLLCTDGLSNKVTTQRMQEILLSDAALNEKTKQLVDEANEMGGDDNISVILIKPKDTEVNQT